MQKNLKKHTQHWQTLKKKKNPEETNYCSSFEIKTHSYILVSLQKNSWKVQMNKNKHPQSQSMRKTVFHIKKKPKQQIICLFNADSTWRKSRKNKIKWYFSENYKVIHVEQFLSNLPVNFLYLDGEIFVWFFRDLGITL